MRLRNNPILKKADRYLGIPLIWGMSMLKNRHNLPPATPRNFILLKTAAIGDTVLLDAVIKEIRRQIPDAEITVVCTKNNRGAVELLTGVDQIIDFRMENPLASFRELAALSEFDCLMDFAPWAHINAVACYFIKSKFKTGFATNGMYRHYLYDKAVIHRDDQHEMDNYRDVLRACNLEVHGLVPHFEVKNNGELLKQCNLEPHKYIIFHAFPGGAAKKLKEWPVQNWLTLAKRLQDKYNYKILLSGGKEDIQAADAMINMGKLQNVTLQSLVGRLSLEETALLLRLATVLITVDTGVMHLGAAVDAAMVSLHGPVAIKRWGPLSTMAKPVIGHMSCQPCISLGFESKCTNPKCMEQITVEMVLHALEDYLIKK